MSFRGHVLDYPIGGERKRFILAALAGVLVLTLSACGTGDASPAATAAYGDGPTVTVEDMAFAPEMLTVEAGDTVTWVFNDGAAVAHDVAGDEFESEVMSEGTFSHRFEEPGTYDYVCTLHPNMTGSVEVTR